MTSAIRAQRDAESGFTLIELLVVVIIIGILAAIAIPAFLNQRESAYQAAIESEARNAAIEVEASFVQNDDYPATDADFTNLAGVNLSLTTVPIALDYTDNGNSFTITACHDLLHSASDCQTVFEVHATYDSAAGGLQ